MYIYYFSPPTHAAGFLIDFISGPVNSGFMSAVAVLIILSQIKDLIGIKSSGTTVPDMATSIFKNIPDYRPVDTCLGIVCIVVILLLRVSVYRIKPFYPFGVRHVFTGRQFSKVIGTCRIGPAEGNVQSKFRVIANRSMWVVGTFRNTIVLVISTYVSYLYMSSVGHDVTTSGNLLPFRVVGTYVKEPRFEIIRD